MARGAFRTRWNTALAPALLALALAAPARAFGDEPGEEDVDELFRKAGQAYDAGEYRGAHALYEQVFARKKTHDVAAMLAQTEMKLGRPCDADRHLAFAIEAFPPSLADERRALLVRAQAAVRRQIGALRVDVVPAGGAVQVDFRPVPPASLPGPFCVAAGDRVVFVERDGFAVERRAVTIEPGATASITVELRRVAPDPAADGTHARVAPPLVSRPIDAATPFLLAVLSAGLGGIAVGSVLLPIALSKHDEANRLRAQLSADGGHAACARLTDYPSECGRLQVLRNDAAGFANAGVASLVTGGVLAAASGGFLVLGASTASTRPGGPRAMVGVVPGGALVALTGAF